jgi:hypothetical protein
MILEALFEHHQAQGWTLRVAVDSGRIRQNGLQVVIEAPANDVLGRFKSDAS